MCYNVQQKMEEQDFSVLFCEWLKRRRKALDMTQDELANRAGCSVGTVRKIESGERRPSKQLAGLLAEALEIQEGDRPLFVRVARGELNIERLQQAGIKPLAPFSEIWNLQKAQQKGVSHTTEQPGLPVTRIPIQATPLIGRDIELAAMERLFEDPQCRLLTLTGTGGIGKTRLAIEFATRNAGVFPGGVYYIPLTAINSPEKIIPTIADNLELIFSGHAEPKEQLINYISNNIIEEALFVLDNLEHLLVQNSTHDDRSGVIELISEFLVRLPNVKILGTSRERLNLHGEWTYELHGLSVPPIDFIGRLEKYDSIALFVKSAQRIRADYQITEDERPPMIQICQLVEGVPLAIELAAAWVGMLSCQEIAQEIQSNMDFLSTSMRGIPERHRSIRATFDHSWKLLSDEERWALCQLSVFHGGFDRDAAQQVARADLLLLGSLSDKSLMHRTESGRYDLHEVIRQYAMSHLDDHAQDLGTYKRHCEYYLTLVRDYEQSLKNASQQAAIRELTGEIDNIRAAWAWAINHKEFKKLGKAGRGFGWYYEVTGLYREGIEQLEMLKQALNTVSQNSERRKVLGLVLLQQALLYFRAGEYVHAQEFYKESISILRPTGDQILLADALIFLGIIQHLQGEYDQSKLSLEEGLVLARACNERWYEAYAIYNLGYIDSLMGHYTEGYEQMLSGLEIWRALGDPHYISLGLNFLVTTLIKLGRVDEAKAFMMESIALCEQANNRWGMGTAYRYLGLALMAEGNISEARAHILKSLDIFGDFTVGWDHPQSLTYLADATVMDGRLAEARNIYQEALRLSVESHSLPIALDALTGLSDLQAQTGETEEALVLCYFVLDHPAGTDATQSRAKQLRTRLEAGLSSEQIEAARIIAHDQSLEIIVKELDQGRK